MSPSAQPVDYGALPAAISRLLARSRYGVGKTKAKALIVMVERSQSQFLAKDLSLSRFLAKRRKLMT